MPLPNDPKMNWPPKGWEKVFDLYREHSAWYSGDPNEIAKVYSSMVPGTSKRAQFWSKDLFEERKTMIHIPVAGDLASVSADMLFGEAPKFTIPEANAVEEIETEPAKPQQPNQLVDPENPDEPPTHPSMAPPKREYRPKDPAAVKAQERLEEIVEAGGYVNQLIEAAETGAALGGVFLKVNWDKDVASYPILSSVQADRAIPEFKWGILSAVTFWKIIHEDDERNQVYRLLERHEPGVIYYGLYKGTPEKLGSEVSFDLFEETKDLPTVTHMPEGVTLACRYVPNMRPHRRFRNSPLGQSDYSGAEGLMDSIDEVYSSWMRDIRLGRGRIIVSEQFLEKDTEGNFGFDLDKEVFSTLDMDALSMEKAGITPTQFAIRMEEHRQTAIELLERIVTGAGYSPQSFGLKIEGRAESGTALNIRERRSLMTRAKKSRFWKSAIEDILEIALIIDKEILGGQHEVYRPSVELQDSLVYDPESVGRTVELLKRASAASTETLVRIVNPQWTDAEIKAEVDKILEESGMGMPSPFEAGID